MSIVVETVILQRMVHLAALAFGNWNQPSGSSIRSQCLLLNKT